jgi:hypothetical protein
MNLLLLFLTLFTIGLILSESSHVKGWFDQIYKMVYKPQDLGVNFLLGVDHINVSPEEVSEFKKFLFTQVTPSIVPEPPVV